METNIYKKASYLEIFVIILQPVVHQHVQWILIFEYLLCSQGDRMAMAHSVEGRFPFLDYRLVEFCNHLPSTLKLHGLTEKWLLKQMGRKLLPDAIWQRVKRPYRAPVHRSFFGGAIPEYVTE